MQHWFIMLIWWGVSSEKSLESLLKTWWHFSNKVWIILQSKTHDTFRDKGTKSNCHCRLDSNCGLYNFYMISCDVIYSTLGHQGGLETRDQRTIFLTFIGKWVILSKHFRSSSLMMIRYISYSFPSKNCQFSVTFLCKIVLPVVYSVSGSISVLS